MRWRSANRRTAIAQSLRGLDHDAAELHDGHVAGAKTLARAIGNWAHGLPHCDVLIRDAGDAGLIATLHRVAVLEVIVGTSADGTVIAVEIDADLRRAKLPPCVLIDALAVAPGDEVKHGVGVVQRDVEDR